MVTASLFSLGFQAVNCGAHSFSLHLSGSKEQWAVLVEFLSLVSSLSQSPKSNGQPHPVLTPLLNSFHETCEDQWDCFAIL